MNINDNINDATNSMGSVPNLGMNPNGGATFAQEVKTENAQPKEEDKKEVIGEHDIVIEDDDNFQFNLDIAEVSDVAGVLSPQQEAQNSAKQVELGTEQSGNITF